MTGLRPRPAATGDQLVRVRSEPYPWPWDGLRGADTVLVLAGWDAHWAARVEPAARHRTQRAVVGLAAAVSAVGGSVVCLAHEVGRRSPHHLPAPDPLASPFVDAASTMAEGAARGGAGQQGDAVGGTAVGGGVTSLWAAGLDGFCGSALDRWLDRRGARQLLVAGHGLEVPVHSTLRSANDRGYECLLVCDAASEMDGGLVASARSQVCMSGGIFGAVADSADVLDALATRSTDPLSSDPLSSDPRPNPPAGRYP